MQIRTILRTSFPYVMRMRSCEKNWCKHVLPAKRESNMKSFQKSKYFKNSSDLWHVSAHLWLPPAMLGEARILNQYGSLFGDMLAMLLCYV